MRRSSLVLAVAAAALTTIISGGAVAAPQQPSPPPGSTAAPAATPKAADHGYQPAPIRWGVACPSATYAAFGIECGTLVVPLDYARPRGAKIKLAVSRKSHDPAAGKYQGVMLVNPGGPGGSGLIYSVFGTPGYVPGTSAQTYDWIGFDPRGVGSSEPALACDGDYFGYDRPNYVPTTDRLERTWLKKAAGYATACRYSDARRLLPHLKTRDTLSDMESLRKALGRTQINFYGFSYGTYLAQTYASLYPNRVRRFVMDGNVDPRRVWYAANLDQDRAFEKTINIYFGWLAKYDAVFHLGDSADEVAAGYYRQLAKLDAAPAAGGTIGPDELTDVLTSAAYYVYGWVEIGEAYAALVNDGDGTAVKQLFDDSYPSGEGTDNGYAVYLGVQCTDAAWPKSWERWRIDNWRTYAQAPFLTWSNAWYNAPCRTWPAKSGRPVNVDGRKVTSKILLISETLDPATPYAGSLEVRRRFPSASLIEGVGGTTHSGSLSGIACTDNAIAAYLANGTVPSRKPGNTSDLQCPPVPQPDPTAADGRSTQRRSTVDQARVLVRKALQEAQR